MSLTRDTICDLETYFGALPGADRTLISWDAMRRWFRDVERLSNRVSVQDIGEGTLGRSMDLLVISAAPSVHDFSSLRDRRNTLSDRALLRDPAHADGRLAGEKPVVLITAGIHADEVGGVQLMPELVRDLAFSNDPGIVELLDRLIILLAPTLNPDGMHLVHDWYMRTMGTRAEGTSPPEIYHPYAGHDNNRDWYAQTHQETRNMVDYVHRPWRPHIVVDLHQMGPFSPRYVLPPYVDPLEPHVHPRITALVNEVGSAAASAHVRAGHDGTASGVIFDCYSPTRAYSHYHGGVRILAEAASAGIATPLEVAADQIEVRRGFDPNLASTHMPMVWHGGTWRLRDIMDRHLTTIQAVLNHAALHRDDWIRDQWTMLAEEVTQESSYLYAVAPLRQQIDPPAAVELVEILRRGDVDITVAETGEDLVHPGSLLIRSDQPFGSHARALLDLTPYPEPRAGKERTPLPVPYDVTSHCLPIHMGVDVARIEAPADVRCRSLEVDDLVAFEPPKAGDVRRDRWLAIDARSHAAVRVVARALRNGSRVRRLLRSHFEAGRLLDAGTWLITDDHVFAAMSDAYQQNVRSWLISPVPQGTAVQSLPRIGLHLPWTGAAIDAGWCRLWLEQAGLPYVVMRDVQIRSGELDDLDVLLIPHLGARQLLEGNSREHWPVEYAGGLGDEGTQALGEFIEAGGVVVALDSAANALIPALSLPVRRPLRTQHATGFSCPGSVLRVHPAPAHPVSLGMSEPVPAMFVNSTAFMVQWEKSGQVPARYAHDDLLVSGWIRGAEHLHDLAAIIDIPLGSGFFTGFGFRPQFRCQMRASEPLLSNALLRAGLG